MLSRPGLQQASALARASCQKKTPCLCAALKSFSPGETKAAYSTSTQHESSSSSLPPGSLFSPHNSPWDKVFEGIEKSTPMYVGQRSDRPSRHRSQNTWRKPMRNQSMTAREKNTFQDMFDMVFEAVGDAKSGKIPSEAPMFTPIDSVGASSQLREMADLFGRLRKDVKKMRWTSSVDEELDRKKEEIELCDTDTQLLEWTMNEVFTSKQPAITLVQTQLAPAQNNQLYPHIIAAIMRTFRDKFHDPHLALSIFDYAKNSSVPSYVFGCTTPVYNELIETRWFCFHDLKGVLDALEEMKVNGVEGDGQTRKIAGMVRRDAPSMQLLEEEDYFGKGQDRVVHILTQIEALLRKPSAPVRSRTIKRTRREKPWSERWKDGVDGGLNKPEAGEDWSWGKWGSPRFA